MQSSYKVKFLDLSHNEFGAAAGEILGPALGKYTCRIKGYYNARITSLLSTLYVVCVADSEVLRTLDLSWNHIRRKGAVAIAAGLKVMTTWKGQCPTWLKQ